jgi:hypothetical protein
VGEANRGEYITASSGRKRLLASLFSSANLTSWSAAKYFHLATQSRIDENFCFE